MSKFTCFVVFIVAVTSSAYAVSEEEKNAFKEVILPLVAECSKTHGISQEQIDAAKQAGTSEGLNSCFVGCVLKKTGVINEQGLYDADTAATKLKQFVKNADDVAKFEEVIKKCSSVNDQAVTDGEAGCEKAEQVMLCFRENKAMLPL